MSNVLVKEILGWKSRGDLGIELECEGTSPLPVLNTAPWTSKGDDSLRGHGMEYVTERPISCDGTKLGHIRTLTDVLAAHGGVVQDSPRTSLHVHVNVLDHTPLQLWTAVATYWLVENLLFQYCGSEEREGNLFCLPLNKAEGVLKYVYQDLKGTIPFDQFYEDRVRYGGINLNAITKFGSVEFRGMRGVTDPTIIDTWSTELYNVMHKSKRFSSPEHMLDTFLAMSAGSFLDLIFSPSFTGTLKTYKGWEKKLKENAALLCEFCYVHDWDKWYKKTVKNCTEAGMVGRTKWVEPPRDNRFPPPRPRTVSLGVTLGGGGVEYDGDTPNYW